MASRLLEHYYSSPEKGFHAGIIRKCNLLHLQKPRPTSPALLLSILCVSCYMPTAQRCAELLGTSAGGFIGIRRSLLSELMKGFHKITLPDLPLSFDDGITSFIVTSIGPSEEAIHSNLPYYVAFLKYIVKKLNLNIEIPELPEEEKEERRRLWWASYIVDRHSSLSLNLRPQFTDQECQDLPAPYPDSIWESQEPLHSTDLGPVEERLQVFGYKIASLDVLGVLVPIFRIVGEILEYHFLCKHATFNSNSDFLDGVRENIQQNLGHWFDSFRAYLPPGFCDSVSQPGSTALTVAAFPTVAYYGLHLYHCMHVLLYGQMDLVRMYEDARWQASPDFLKAGKHAMACANITRSIIVADPHFYFLYRLFGTYLVQSSFIFLILARKFGPMSDQLILDNCAINLQILDIFVQNSNMRYQRDFARTMRRTLEKSAVDREARTAHSDSAASEAEPLDPELLQYRWIAGYSGLWTSSTTERGG